MINGIMHHITESNWINFVIAGLIIYFSWSYISGLQEDNEAYLSTIETQQQLIDSNEVQLKNQEENFNIVVSDIYTRLDNKESSKQVANSKWDKVREIEY